MEPATAAYDLPNMTVDALLYAIFKEQERLYPDDDPGDLTINVQDDMPMGHSQPGRLGRGARNALRTTTSPAIGRIPMSDTAAGLAREVAELRKAVMRLLDIMEADKRRSMRSAGIVAGVAFGLLFAMIVMAVQHAV